MIAAGKRRGAVWAVLLLLLCSAGCNVLPWRWGKHTEKGIASWYGDEYQGRPTASGEIFDQERMTAGHRTLPFDTLVLVKDLRNGKTVRVRINDRGPFIRGRIIDLSKGAARQLGMIEEGLAPVRIEVLKWGRRR
jgi:rare lipoprotein A